MNPYNTRPIEILLVEDSPADAGLATEALKEARIANNLTVVEDGEQAMDFLYRRGKYANAIRPDLILLDLNLPRKDRREVLKEIKTDPNLKRIPVVVLTTSQDERDVMGSYEAYANCYITKPVDFEQFMAVVRSVEGFWLAIVTLPPNGRPIY